MYRRIGGRVEVINIPKQLWYVGHTVGDNDLAYMTYYEDNAAFLKRKSTGLDWANRSLQRYNRATGKYEYPNGKLEDGVIIDNNPTSDIYIGSSVSRWSTSNKLFRVQDPRGFTVEVPTDNIATLLHLTTVKNGVVQEPCVWGREGNNHILLPINSEPYLNTLEQMDTLANKLIKLSELSVGDVVSFFEDKFEYTYLGKIKVTWKCKPYTSTSSSYWDRKSSTKFYHQEQTVKDTKWEHVFTYVYTWEDGRSKTYYETKNNPKITKVVGKADGVEELRSGYKESYPPQRVISQLEWEYRHSNFEYGIAEVEWK